MIERESEREREGGGERAKKVGASGRERVREGV